MQKIYTDETGKRRKRISLFFGEMAVYWRDTGLDDPRKRELWGQQLGDLDYTTAKLALEKLAQTLKFPPTIAEIREAAASITRLATPSELDAWSATRKVMEYGRYAYHEAKAYIKRQDPVICSVLLGLGMMQLFNSEPEHLRTTVMRLYRVADKERQTSAVMSDGLKELISNAREKIVASHYAALTDGEEGGGYE